MSKYSSDFKLKVVKYCIEDNHSSYDASKTFKIPVSLIKPWISKYRKHGYEEIISYNLSRHSVFNQVIDMLEKAFSKIPNNTNLILHSDQG